VFVSRFPTIFLRSVTSTYVLIMTLVPLKLWCRKRVGGWGNLGLDDLLTAVSLLLANSFFYVCVIGKHALHGISMLL
jgi:hypothetical protein